MMPVKKMLNILAMLTLILTGASCGSQGAGGGTAEFKTVYVTTPKVTSEITLRSDIALWSKDTNGDEKTEICVDAPSLINDDAKVEIEVTPYPSITPTSAVKIGNGSIAFTPANILTPPLPPLYANQPFPVNYVIPEGGGTVEITVPLVSHALKEYLWGTLLCTGLTYNYYATITFDITEINTNISKSVSTQMTVIFTDFVDK